MSINEKVITNPELIEANIIVGNELNDLIDRKWGNVTMSFTVQSGKITTLKITQEKIFKLSGREFESKS